jgi:hypothetical protein
MHLLIPFAASADPACRSVLRDLRLPNLEKLLRRMEPQPAMRQSENQPQLPHEQILGQALGLPTHVSIPWAALAAAAQGFAIAGQAWAFITPCHWQVAQAQVTLLDPQQLGLQEDESRALLSAMQPYFAEDGISLHYERADRWLAQGDIFRILNSASLERVIGQDVTPWMPASSTLRRLQNEMQMLLYSHPVNDARASRRALTVNSLWVSGCGALAAAPIAPKSVPHLVTGLMSAALQQDWRSWGEAWQALDAQDCAALLAALEAGDSTARLTLCSEDCALEWLSAQRGLWQSLASLLRPPTLAAVWKQL